MIYKEIEKLHKDEIIKLHTESKYRPKKIAYILKIDTNHVYYLLEKFKVYTRRKRTPAEIEKLKVKISGLIRTGLTHAEIGKKLKVSRELVCFYNTKYKLERK